AAHVYALDLHTSGKNAAIRSAGQAEITGDLPTHALRVANTNSVGARGNIKAHGTVGVIDAAGETQRAAAYLRSDIFEKQSRGIEDQIAFYVAETGREVDGARLSIFDMHFAGDARTVQRSFEGRVDLCRPASVKIGNESAKETRVKRTVEIQIDVSAPGKTNIAGDLEVGIRSMECRGLDAEFIFGRAEVDGSDVFELHV